jgi:hypothetical protein
LNKSSTWLGFPSYNRSKCASAFFKTLMCCFNSSVLNGWVWESIDRANMLFRMFRCEGSFASKIKLESVGCIRDITRNAEYWVKSRSLYPLTISFTSTSASIERGLFCRRIQGIHLHTSTSGISCLVTMSSMTCREKS